MSRQSNSLALSLTSSICPDRTRILRGLLLIAGQKRTSMQYYVSFGKERTQRASKIIATRSISLMSGKSGRFTYTSSRDSAQEIADPSEVEGYSECRRRMLIPAQMNTDGGEAFG